MSPASAPLVMRAEIAYTKQSGHTDDDKKKSNIVSFTAATQGGVLTFFGTQHLLISGMDLKRFRNNPIILFNHNMDKPIGRAVTIEREPEALRIDVEFGSNDLAQEVKQNIDDGIVRAMSIGFLPNRASAVFVEEGKEKKVGNITATGPATVFRKSELFESSVVTVPADANALRRQFDQLWEERDMAKETKPKTIPVVDADAEARAADTPPVPPATHENEIAAAYDSKREAEIRAIAPRGMEKFADVLILKRKSVEEARIEFLAAQEKLLQPVGTPPSDAEIQPKEDKRKVTADLLTRSLVSPRSEGFE